MKENALMHQAEVVFSKGNRVVVRRFCDDYRVLCSSCFGGGVIRYPSQTSAVSAAERGVKRACPVDCGAK